MEYKDYYKILGVNKNSNQDEIKKAYKTLARRYHPDLNPNNKKKAEEKFKDINEAYQVLGNPEKKAKYDQLGYNWDKISNQGWGEQQNYAGAGSQHFRSANFSDFFETFFGGHAGAGINLEDLLGGFGTRHTEQTSAIDQEFEIEITPAEALNSGKRVFTIPSSQLCNVCRGSGYTVKSASYRGRNISSRSVCPQCSGTGLLQKTKTIEVKIPKGVKHGTKIKLSGQGGLDPGTGRRGSLYLNVKLIPPPMFTTKGEDLYLYLPVYPYEAMLGKTVNITSPTGSTISLKIPQGTQNDQLLKLKGKGIQSISGLGDLYVRIRIIIPKNISAKEKRLMEEWQSIRDGDNIRKGY